MIIFYFAYNAAFGVIDDVNIWYGIELLSSQEFRLLIQLLDRKKSNGNTTCAKICRIIERCGVFALTNADVLKDFT